MGKGAGTGGDGAVFAVNAWPEKNESMRKGFIHSKYPPSLTLL
jgi:hypothetical protein